MAIHCRAAKNSLRGTLTESWLQIVEVAIISVGMSVQDTVLTMFIILPSSNDCKAYLTLAPLL